MARLARSTVIGFPHQVTQRGNCDQTVFENEEDYRRYLEYLGDCASRYSVSISAYCLMPNHVHYVCVPGTEDGLARTFNTVHMRYARFLNNRRGVTGQLWKGRFLSCILDGPSAFEEVRFIENNPVRWGLVKQAEDYAWSSARSHVLGVPDPILSDGASLGEQIDDWRIYLAGEKDEPTVSRIRQSLKTGRPAGDGEFVRMLEEQTGRRLSAMPRGRPRKVLIP